MLARSDGEELRVHCPNPGRLREILLPGRNLILEKAENPHRKTQWTLAAAEYKGLTIPLVSAHANRMVGDLVLPHIYPGYSTFPEKTLGGSRFDWYLEKELRKIWIEVKACTLVEQGRALFPDAPSIRARKHTEELTLIKDGSSREIIFAVMNPTARMFSPNPHTDPELVLSLKKASDAGVSIRAVSFNTDEKGSSRVVKWALPVDMRSADLVDSDSGVIIRTWKKPGDKEAWTIDIERYPGSMCKSIRRPLKKSEQETAFPVFGQLGCFDSIENELSEFVGSEKGNPASNPDFLDLILDYRHRRVFNF